MVGAVKPKLGHCHLRKLFDRKESSAPIKLFLQLLSFKKVSCLFIPLFPLIYTNLGLSFFSTKQEYLWIHSENFIKFVRRR